MSITWNNAQNESLRTVESIREARVIGSQPHRELESTMTWIVFESSDFNKPLAVTFLLANRDPFTVAYALKARDRSLFFINESYGILKPGASAEVRLTLRKSEHWSRAAHQMARQQIAVENLRVSERVVSQTPEDGRLLARDIFKRSSNENPHQRLYWKISVIINKKEGAEKA